MKRKTPEIDMTTPEYFGWLSVQPGWKQVLRNPYKPGSSHAHRYQVAREEALGKSKSRFGPVETKDRQVEAKRFHYHTDGGEAA